MEESIADGEPSTLEVLLRQNDAKPEKPVLLQGTAELLSNKVFYRIALVDLSHVDAMRIDLLRSHRVLDQMREGVN